MNLKYEKQHVSWNEWSPKIIAKYFLKQTGPKHYNGPCPQCCGTNRFYISESNGAVLMNCNQGCEFKQLVEVMRDDGTYPQLLQRDEVKLTQPNDNPCKQTGTPQLYHERKGIDLHGAQIDGTVLKIPIQNIDGIQVGVQKIWSNGNKKFTSGTKIKGAFAIIGGPIEGLIYMCEGWATAASVAEATGRPAVFALSADNLPLVAAALREKHPKADFFVAADNDKAGLEAVEKLVCPGLHQVKVAQIGMIEVRPWE